MFADFQHIISATQVYVSFEHEEACQLFLICSTNISGTVNPTLKNAGKHKN
uniref:Uncharacterized protein n=1 Tax=Rhizophora mucronata TaxID=61149 RepID=A0A2P2PJC9_RHIMU